MTSRAAQEDRGKRWGEWMRRFELGFKTIHGAAPGYPQAIHVMHEVDESLGDDFLDVLDDFLSRLTLADGVPGYAIDTPDGFRTVVTPRLLQSKDSSSFRRVMDAVLETGAPVRTIALSARVSHDMTESWNLVLDDEGGCWLAVWRGLSETATSFANASIPRPDPVLFARAAADYLRSR